MTGKNERVADVQITEDILSVRLIDGRSILVPFEWCPRLASKRHGAREAGNRRRWIWHSLTGTRWEFEYGGFVERSTGTRACVAPQDAQWNVLVFLGHAAHNAALALSGMQDRAATPREAYTILRSGRAPQLVTIKPRWPTAARMDLRPWPAERQVLRTTRQNFAYPPGTRHRSGTGMPSSASLH